MFVPHIYEYRENTPKVLKALLENGRLDGFECYYSTFSDKQHNEILEIAKKNNLYISGGSDFHGTPKPDIDIGVGKGNLQIPDIIQENWAIYKY